MSNREDVPPSSPSPQPHETPETACQFVLHQPFLQLCLQQWSVVLQHEEGNGEGIGPRCAGRCVRRLLHAFGRRG